MAELEIDHRFFQPARDSDAQIRPEQAGDAIARPDAIGADIGASDSRGVPRPTASNACKPHQMPALRYPAPAFNFTRKTPVTLIAIQRSAAQGDGGVP